MVDRTVVYRLQADSRQLKTEMAAASTSVRNAGVQMEGANAKGKKFSAGLDGLGVSAGLVAAGGIAAVVGKAADFDQAMSNVQAATHESAAAMSQLREAAMQAGAETAFSATEAAAGIENLAKAGVDTAEILDGGLSGALALAAAGGMDVASAAEAAAGAMAQFKLEGDQVPHIADLLAAAAGNAQGEVSDFTMALKQGGTVAAQTGLSLEETVGTLAAMAEQSLLGSDAGTSFKTMLSSLTPNSDKARKAMEQYNIQAFDAQGNFVGMTELAGQLRAGLGDLTDEQRAMALETIFGSDAVRAASIVYDNGAEGIAKWTAQVNDAGYAAETAATKQDNLRGDIEKLSGALETAFIGSGESSQNSLRTTTQLLTELVDVLSEAQNGSSAFSEGIRGATDQLSVLNGGEFQTGLSNIKTLFNDSLSPGEKFKAMLFTVKDAEEEAAEAGALWAMAADGLAGAQTDAADGALQLKEAARLSAEEIEAQAKALQDARKAAHDTASGFVTLGESLNDSKRSLGQWLNEMQQTREALENFTQNARNAAKRGLDEGLIKSLAEAGPEGALRMKQLANASKEELGRANREFRGTEGAVRDLAKVLLNIPQPKLKVDNGKALNDIDALEARLRAIRDEDVFINVRRIGDTTLGPRNEAADGGSVPKGGAYFDKHLYMLAPGEEIISNRHGQADAFRSDRAAGRIPGYADGGTTGKKPKKLKLESSGEPTMNLGAFLQAGFAQAEAQRDAAIQQMLAAQQMVSAADAAADAAKAQDEAADKALEAAQAQYDSMKSQTAGLFDIDPLARPDSAWGAGGDPFASLQDIIDRTSAYSASSTALSARGLDGAALTYGLGSEDRMAQLTAMSDEELVRFEEMFNAANEGVLEASTTAADLAYGAQVAAATATAVQSEATLQASLVQQQIAVGALAAIDSKFNVLQAQMADFAERLGEAAASGVRNGGNAVARRGNRD